MILHFSSNDTGEHNRNSRGRADRHSVTAAADQVDQGKERQGYFADDADRTRQWLISLGLLWYPERRLAHHNNQCFLSTGKSSYPDTKTGVQEALIKAA